ncbi:hypothetical protein B1028_18675 [Escherichia coli]|nr:hypothetical protein B1028_18675 [Escherichia coli]
MKQEIYSPKFNFPRRNFRISIKKHNFIINIAQRAWRDESGFKIHIAKIVIIKPKKTANFIISQISYCGLFLPVKMIYNLLQTPIILMTI